MQAVFANELAFVSYRANIVLEVLEDVLFFFFFGLPGQTWTNCETRGPWVETSALSILITAGWRSADESHNRKLNTEAHERNSSQHTYIRVESQLTDVTGDDLFLLGHHGNAKGVVDDGLLHRVHLQETHRGQRSPACLGLAEQ